MDLGTLVEVRAHLLGIVAVIDRELRKPKATESLFKPSVHDVTMESKTDQARLTSDN